MPLPLKCELPPDCTLSAGYIIRITALDPTTGAAVTGITLSDISFFVTDVGSPQDQAGELTLPLLVPADSGE